MSAITGALKKTKSFVIFYSLFLSNINGQNVQIVCSIITAMLMHGTQSSLGSSAIGPCSLLLNISLVFLLSYYSPLFLTGLHYPDEKAPSPLQFQTLIMPSLCYGQLHWLKVGAT